ncbi:retrovirus-related pol polyprotein from transposon TNT 1-94, partial [Tanacetum coccineum]
MKVEESLNVTLDESPPPIKSSPLVDDDVGEEEAIEGKVKVDNNVETESIEVYEVVNIKESKSHPLGQVIGNLNQRTLRSQDKNKSNFFCFISTIEPKNANEALGDKRTKWLFRNKLDENGIVSRNKARLVAHGYNQQEGIDYDEAYALVAKLESIWILLARACVNDFKLYQMDVKRDVKEVRLEDSKPTKTLMSTGIQLTKDDKADSMDNTKYRGFVSHWKRFRNTVVRFRKLFQRFRSTVIRPSMLEKGNYIPWESRFRRFLNNKLEKGDQIRCSIEKGPYVRLMIPNPYKHTEQILELLSKMTEVNKKQYIADVRVMNYLLQAIPNDIYNSMDACKNAKDMWERIKRLMFGFDVTNHVRHSRLVDKFNKFAAKDGESLESVYERLTTLVNIMDHNNVHPIPKSNVIRGRVDIQTKNVGYGRNGNRNAGRQNMNQAFNEGTGNDESNQIVQPDDNAVSEPSYDAKAVSKVNASTRVHEQVNRVQRKTIIHTADDDQIDSNIIFNDPYVENNGGTSEHDSTAHNEYHDIKMLAYNYKETCEELEHEIYADKDTIKRILKEKDKIESDFFKIENEKIIIQHETQLAKKAFKERENRYLEDIYDLEEKLSSHDRIVYKMDQSIQTIHMLGKEPNKVYDLFLKAGLGYKNPEHLKKAIAVQPKMYDGEMIHSISLKIDSPDSKETLEDAEEKPSAEQTYFSIPATSNDCSETKENQDLLMTISELKNKLKTVDKGKNVNTKFDKSETSGTLLCVTPLPKNIAVKAKKVSNTKVNADRITKTETQTLDSKSNINVSNSTCVESSNSFRRPKSKDNKSKDRILKNTNDKRPSAQVRKMSSSVSIDSNKRETMHSNVIQLVLWIVDSGCSKHMTGNLSLLRDFIEKFIGTVRFGNDHFAAIMRYQDLKFNASHDMSHLLMTISELKNKIKTIEKGKNVNTKFGKSETSRTLLCVTPLPKNIAVQAKKVLNTKVIQLILWIVDSGCSNHMTGNLQLLRNFIEKFMGTVRFENDHFAAITGYGDYVQGNFTICHVYYVEGLGHNLF